MADPADVARYLDTEEVLKAKVQVLANLIRSSERRLMCFQEVKLAYIGATLGENELSGPWLDGSDHVKAMGLASPRPLDGQGKSENCVAYTGAGASL